MFKISFILVFILLSLTLNECSLKEKYLDIRQASGMTEFASLNYLKGKWQFNRIFDVSKGTIDELDITIKNNSNYIIDTLPTFIHYTDKIGGISNRGYYVFNNETLQTQYIIDDKTIKILNESIYPTETVPYSNFQYGIYKITINDQEKEFYKNKDIGELIGRIECIYFLIQTIDKNNSILIQYRIARSPDSNKLYSFCWGIYTLKRI